MSPPTAGFRPLSATSAKLDRSVMPVGGGLTLDGLMDPLTSNTGPNGETWEGHGLLDAGGGDVNVSASASGTEALLLNQVHDEDQVRSEGSEESQGSRVEWNVLEWRGVVEDFLLASVCFSSRF